MNGIKNIVIVCIIVFLFIFYIVNNKINDESKKVNENKKERSLKSVFIKYLCIFLFVFVIFLNIVMIIIHLYHYFENTENFEKIITDSQKKIQQQLDFYEEIIKRDYDIEKCKNPYMLDGFEYVEGSWDTGYVIQDMNGNEYVWVPCTNKENDEGIEILRKSNFSEEVFINKFDCNDEKYEEFLVSSLENGGFYISRYEMGKDEEENVVSKKGYEIWTNISRQEIKNLIKNMYTNINAELINGYAYDVVMSWIINSENVETNNKSGDDIYTGTIAYKNIYDILDNIYEVTSEESYGEMIYRGIFNDSEYIEVSESGKFDNRLSGSLDYKSEYLGFRIILYK